MIKRILPLVLISRLNISIFTYVYATGKRLLSIHEFSRACKEMASEFPKVSPWLQRYLHPERASGFFPACQKFTTEEKSRFSRLSTSTNAQENVGKQFQYLFMNKNRKMGVNESILAAFKFVNRFELDRRLTARGMSTAYAQYPRSATPRKKRHVKNDGRAPDTNKSLRIEKPIKEQRKQKKLDLQNIPDELVPSYEQESRDNENTSMPQTQEDSNNNKKPNPASTPPEIHSEQSNYQDTLCVNDMIYHSMLGIDVVKDLRVESHRSRIVEVRALPDDSSDDDDDAIIVETGLGYFGLQSDAVVSKKPDSRGKAIKYFTLIPGVDKTPVSQTLLFRAAEHASEEMEKEASQFSFTTKEHIFRGPRWGIRGVLSNSCSLDCFLVLFYVPWHVGQLHSSYPELEVKDSFLSHTFSQLMENKYDDIRMRWIKTLLKSQWEAHEMKRMEGLVGSVFDAYGETERFYNYSELLKDETILETIQGIETVHPLQVSITTHFKNRFVCRREGGCRRVNQEKENTVQYSTYCFPANVAAPESLFEKLFQYIGPCSTKWLTGVKCECGSDTGNIGTAREIKWPHTLLLEFWDQKLHKHNPNAVNEIPREYTIEGKTLILRGCTVFDRIRKHFIALIKCNEGWIQYDGTPTFHFYSNEECKNLMTSSMELNVATYEVVDEKMVDTDESAIEWEKLLEMDNVVRHRMTNTMSMSKSLRQLSQEIIGRKEKKNTDDVRKEKRKRSNSEQMTISHWRSNQPKSASKQRIPKGFSLRQKVPSRGRRAKCAGCNNLIEYEDCCIRHRYRKVEQFEYDDVNNYHCRATCLMKMKPEHLVMFVDKKWVEPDVVRVVKEIQHFYKNV